MSTRVVLVAVLLAASCSSLHAHEVASKPELAKIETIAVLPFDNLTGLREAGPAVTRAVSTALTSQKLSVVTSDKLEVAHSRVDPPPSSSVDRLVALRVGQLTNADAVMYGTVTETASPGQDAVNLAALGVSVRVVEVASGRILLSATYSATRQGSLQSEDDLAPLAADAASAIAQRVRP